MSSKVYWEGPDFDPLSCGDVLCELTGGGSQDGLVLMMSRRFKYIHFISGVPVRDGDSDASKELILEGIYEARRRYRICPERGRIYLYEFEWVDNYEQHEFEQRIEEANEATGANLVASELYGPNGFDECDGRF